MIQFIKNLWIKWKYRKYFRSLKTQSEYYDQLARALNKAYWEMQETMDLENCACEIPVEFLESDIPELKGDLIVPDLLHSPVKCNEIYVNGKKVK